MLPLESEAQAIITALQNCKRLTNPACIVSVCLSCTPRPSNVEGNAMYAAPNPSAKRRQNNVWCAIKSNNGASRRLNKEKNEATNESHLRCLLGMFTCNVQQQQQQQQQNHPPALTTKRPRSLLWLLNRFFVYANA